MPTKLSVNEMYTSNTFYGPTSTLRGVLEEDNLPLSKTIVHDTTRERDTTRDTFLVGIVC